MYLVKEIENSWESLDNNIAIFEDFPTIKQIRNIFYNKMNEFEYLKLINGEKVRHSRGGKEYFLNVQKIKFNKRYEI